MQTHRILLPLNFIWVGSWVPSRDLDRWIAASPAAMKWQRHLIASLKEHGTQIHWIFYRPEPFWPKGRLLPWAAQDRYDICPAPDQEIPYINGPWFRDKSLALQFRRIIKSSSACSKGGVTVILSYNAPSWLQHELSNSRLRSRCIWVCIVADDEAPNNADAYVFLSYGYYNRFDETKKKLHLDGGVYPPIKLDECKFPKRKKVPTVFMYSGTLGKWGGVETLLDAISRIGRRDFNVWLSGPGFTSSLAKRLEADQRVSYLGVLSDAELAYAYATADVFLNPRPTKIQGNENNFPSKLFDYLGWGKPVISTWTEGLAPEYREILYVVNDDPSSIADMMIDQMNGHKNIDPSIYSSLLVNKSWYRQAERLLSFLDECMRLARE